jgi:hypothetical protein
MRKLPTSILASLLALPLFTSCEMYTHKGPFPAYSKQTLIPQRFLYSDYEPLNNWLDTPIRVLIQEVPLDKVFDHPALRGVNFKIERSHPKPTIIDIDSIALTRRQLLWTLCYDNELSMVPIFHETGGPSYIQVKSRKEIPKTD